MSEKVKVNIYMTPEMLKALKHLAKLMDRPYAEVVRVACKNYILTHAAGIAAERAAMDQVSKP